MRIKLDENLPTSVSPSLRALGHDVDTVPEEQLNGRDDGAIWQAAQDSRRFPGYTRPRFLRHSAVSSRDTSWHTAPSSAQPRPYRPGSAAARHFPGREYRILGTLFCSRNRPQNPRGQAVEVDHALQSVAAAGTFSAVMAENCRQITCGVNHASHFNASARWPVEDQVVARSKLARTTWDILSQPPH